MEEQKHGHKRHSAVFLIFLSVLIFSGFYIVDQVLRWSNPLAGLMNGLVHSVVYGMAAALIYFIPWTVLIVFLYRWRKWRRYRSRLILVPAIVMAGMMLSHLITRPPTPSVRFEWTTKIPLPENAKELRHSFSGGGMADYHDTYYFETTPEEVERLISGMKLKPGDSWEYKERYHPAEMKNWDQAKAYSHYDEEDNWLYSLVTDFSRRKVFVRVSCM